MVPQLSKWPPGLPEAQRTPDGVFLLPALADAIDTRLLECEALPAEMKRSGEHFVHLLINEFEIEAQSREAIAYTRAVEEIRATTEWAGWKTGLLFVGIGIGALATGFVIGIVYSQR